MLVKGDGACPPPCTV